MHLRTPRKVTSVSWLISMTVNLLLLCLLAWLPKAILDRDQTALKVDLIRAPARRDPPPRVTARRPAATVSRPSRQAAGTPSRPTPPGMTAVPVTTHARHIVRSSDEPVLLSADTPLPDNLPVRLDAPLVDAPATPDAQTERSQGKAVGALARQTGLLQGIEGEIGESPQAQVSGSGEGVEGFYDIATVQHEDAADAMRSQALIHLAMAMNRWTNVRTRFVAGRTPLADPAIHRIPLVYIAVQEPFAFSEKERANLRTYLGNGGTLVFSDLSPDWGTEGAVSNSVRFELWRILGQEYNLQPVRRGAPVCSSFFEFNDAPRVDRRKGDFYALRLHGRVAVFYDAAGIGSQWVQDDSDEKWLQWGVNLLVYALTARGHQE